MSQRRFLHRSTVSARSALVSHFGQKIRLPLAEQSPATDRLTLQWHHMLRTQMLKPEREMRRCYCLLVDHAAGPWIGR